MNLIASVLSVFRRVTIVIAIAIAFLFGVVTTVYLSLRSPEVMVPDVVGKNRFDAEQILADSNLKFRVRASRPNNQAKPDTVLFQMPRPGQVVKAGQTVAMDISRATKEGESSETVSTPEVTNENRNTNVSANSNDDKPKRNKNKNANANGNSNANNSNNSNRLPNSNRSNTNSTVDNANTPRANVNRSSERNANSPTNSNVNENQRPVVAPKPTPSVPDL